MHMADALLSPVVGGTMWAGTLGVLSYAGGKLRQRLDERVIPYMGVLAAFVFAAQMINFTIPVTGSSGHLGGGLLLAVLLGPHAAFLAMASVLVIQAFFFADGGLLALGANVWNLGVYPCFFAYPLIYRPIAGNGTPQRPRVVLASVAAAVVGLQVGAFSVVIQTTLSGITELPFLPFLGVMQPIHLVIGLVEGLVTAAVILAIGSLEPGALAVVRMEPSPSSLKRPLIVMAILALLAGGFLSWFASENPDGLEWSIQKISGSPEPSAHSGAIGRGFDRLREETAVLPDYELPGIDSPAAGTSAAGFIGGALVIILVVGAGTFLRILRSRRKDD